MKRQIEINKDLFNKIYNYLSRELEIDTTCVELNELLDELDEANKGLKGLEEQVAKALQKNIYEYVKKHFGQSEADDPSWCIEALAEELAKGNLKYDIYRAVERDYLRMDCDYIAEQNDISLTEEERERAVDEFMDCEAYVDAHAEDWLYWIKQIKKGE